MDDELAGWIRLQLTPGVGPVSGRRLLSAFGPPCQIFQRELPSLRALVPEQTAVALAAPPDGEMRKRIETSLEWATREGNRIITLADPEYPPCLLEIPDPPLVLYAKGRSELLGRPAIAVVGSRNATTQGMINAEQFSEALSVQGLAIISGLALGIDAAAHRGGLRGSGSSIAVTGTGPDIIYPARNRALALELAQNGCVISEYPLGTPALAANFPRRNRIISGLARGVLVIEAAERSGSLITARTAADQGRDVFAIPGSIHSPLSKGCHLLIKQGAKLVEGARDILEELDYGPRAPAREPSAPAEDEASDDGLLGRIGHDPICADELAARAGLPAGELQARLLELELQGMIEMLPGGRVRRVVTP
ncbi:DNA-processing protein DprA [Noviherbaspirillum aridicola]|uniref:DNA-processing protein DprA n=1 Tax=Noviherbaspirillum aridicola TaxID=2849687 RepID=UPI00283A9A6A|nr:DNA-processing protein DprA [Noviherbaspirillum aridicola]